jgi:tRNA (guanine37-N1)-methyltransferase
MHFTIVTLFPEMFSGPFSHSIIKRAQEKESITIDFVQIRDFATDKHKSVDDKPYGGGAGMVMKVDVVDKALSHAKQLHVQSSSSQITLLLDPRGKQYKQQHAQHYATTFDHIILLCGHYEGVDERIRSLVDEQLSIGDYVVTGGEIPAMIVVDSITRLLPGVIDTESPVSESFNQGLEYPQYTRPPEYNNVKVPDILLSGNHKAIEEWKRQQSRDITKQYRPDLLITDTSVKK